jgi:hypothetical protein
MDHFAGLDVSVKEISVFIVDDAGKIVRESQFNPISAFSCRPPSKFLRLLFY